MIFAACGMAWLTRIGVHSGYVSAVLPPLLVDGAGIGLIVAPSINTGTFGVPPEDAGVASASVNTGQQLGGRAGRDPGPGVIPGRSAGTTPALAGCAGGRGKQRPPERALAERRASSAPRRPRWCMWSRATSWCRYPT